MNTDDKRVVDVESAFTPEYRETLTKIARTGECPAPFCVDSADYHKHSIEKVTKHWKVTRNSFNYQQARIPFLLVLREHVEDFMEVSAEAWAELRELTRELIREHDIRGATLMFRFGDKPHTGASVTHLHAHLVVGYLRGRDSEPIKGVVGFGRSSTPEDLKT
jgi:ATP adenylyltransferase